GNRSMPEFVSSPTRAPSAFLLLLSARNGLLLPRREPWLRSGEVDAKRRVQLSGLQMVELDGDVEHFRAPAAFRMEAQLRRVGFRRGVKKGVDFPAFVEQCQDLHALPLRTCPPAMPSPGSSPGRARHFRRWLAGSWPSGCWRGSTGSTASPPTRWSRSAAGLRRSRPRRRPRSD